MGGLRPILGEGELGSHVTQCRWGWGLPPYQVASWSIQQFGRNRHGPKIGGSTPFWGARAGSPSNTVWPGLRPTCTPSYMLIHPTVWPQYTNITERQDRTDNSLIAYGEPFYKRSPKIDETNRPVAHCILSTQHLFGDAILLDHRVRPSTFIGRRRRRRLVLPEWL